MSDTKKLNNITRAQIAKLGVQALADKPNSASRFGESGLSAKDLKLWFDKLATFLAEKINEMQDTMSSDDAAKYVRLCLDEFQISNLADFVSSFKDGSLVAGLLKAYPSVAAQDLVPIQSIINSFSKSLADLAEDDVERLSVDFEKEAQILRIKGYNAGEEVLFEADVKIDAGLTGTGLTVVDGALCVTIEN